MNKCLCLSGYCSYRHRFLLTIFLWLAVFNNISARPAIALSAKDYSSQKYIDSATVQSINQLGYVKGLGSVEYKFDVTDADAGWYELWIDAVNWPTDVMLDGVLIAHTALPSNLWAKSGNLLKVFNLNIGVGNHVLKFERLYFPGLPYIKNVLLKPAVNIAGSVHATAKANALVFRRNEVFSLGLVAGKFASPNVLNLSIRDTATEKIITTFNQSIPGGIDIYTGNITIPTDKEGVFDLDIKNTAAGYVDRTLQYAVIDTAKSASNTGTQISKQLITTIEPTVTAPNHFSIEPTKTGAILESGSNGVYENSSNPDYFSYTLQLPDKNGFYLVEIDYPDDKSRAFTISIVDEAVNPYPLDSGVVTGGKLPLSNTTQTSRLFFYARTINPRLLFLNCHTNQKIAINRIRLYKILSGLPPLITQNPERQFGTFFEEPLRFTTYFGAGASSSEWGEIRQSADRWAEWSRFIGSNVWVQSIANYQSMMWPSLVLPGYAPSEEDGHGLIGPTSLKDPMQKDLIRLLLLIAEKNNISFIGELNIPMIGFIRKGLDIRFGGAGDTNLNSTETPWLTVSDQGKIGGDSPFDPYLNPVHPSVQQWVADLFSELANRYKDSPAFNGLAIRLMSWTFASWQAFPSIHWGYDDYTVGLFEKETGINVPPVSSGNERFKQRYDWLTQNRYNEWVSWRCDKIYSFYKKLSGILQTARPDLKLYINAFGPDYSAADWGQYGGWSARANKINKLGWSNVIKESGIDPEMFKSSPEIVLSNAYFYQPGVRASGLTAKQQEDAEWQEANDPAGIQAAIKSNVFGIENSAQFINNYMEYDFPVKNIGISKVLRRNAEKIRISGVLWPPGKLVLMRYLNAMAEGNVTFFTDGGLGYILGQPNELQPFLTEYYSLPKIGMKKLAGTGNDVALWYGNRAGVVYCYLVNRSSKAINVKISFSNNAITSRVSSGLAVDVNNVLLPSYSLIALKNIAENSVPIKVDTLSGM